MKNNLKVLAGFDGFVDTIAKPVLMPGKAGETPKFFKSIEEFGRYISGRSEKGASIELKILEKRLGGNMPNFAGGIAALGADVCAIGMLNDGNGSIDPVFRGLPGKIFSFAPAGTATALEFEDGKIFLAPEYILEGEPWTLVEGVMEKNSAGMTAILKEACLIALLNWSELVFMDELWRELFEKCNAVLESDKEKFILFDLCDVSRRSGEEIRSVLDLIGNFSALRTTILSLNLNEAILLGRLLACPPPGDDLAGIAEQISASWTIDELVIHTHAFSLIKTREGIFRAETAINKSPRISTGAGDHFNAAYAFAALKGMKLEDRLRFANHCAGIYVSSGIMPKDIL